MGSNDLKSFDQFFLSWFIQLHGTCVISHPPPSSTLPRSWPTHTWQFYLITLKATKTLILTTISLGRFSLFLCVTTVLGGPSKLSIFSVRTASFLWRTSNCLSWSQQLPLAFTEDGGVLTGVDQPLGELEDGVLQGRTEGEWPELQEAMRGKVGEVSSSPDSLSVRTSWRLKFSERDRDLSREIHGRSYPQEQLELFSKLSK